MRKLVFIQGTPAEPEPFPALVWGEDWTYTIPFSQSSAIYAIAEADNEVPTQVSKNATGLMYDIWGLVMGKTLTGNPDPLTLGAVHVHYKGYEDWYVGPEPPSYENLWYQPTEGADFEADTTCKFRIYAGECEVLPEAFTREDVLALLNGEAATGPRTSLHYHARNVEIQFPATSTAKYRVLAVPTAVFNAGASIYSANLVGNTGRTANRLRYVDDTDVTTTGNYIYGSMTTGGGYMIWRVYVIAATAASFSVFLRALASNVQNLGSTQPSNYPTPAGYNTSPWTDVNTWSKPPDSAVVGVDVYNQIAWAGRWALENLEVVPRTYNLTDEQTVTYSTSAGTFKTATVNNNVSSLLFGAWDTSTDLFGASGYLQAVQLKVNTASTISLGGSQLALFVNNATVDITLDCTRNVSAVTGGIDNWGNAAKLYDATSSSVHLTTCSVTAYLYLDGPTGDPA